MIGVEVDDARGLIDAVRVVCDYRKAAILHVQLGRPGWNPVVRSGDADREFVIYSDHGGDWNDATVRIVGDRVGDGAIHRFHSDFYGAILYLFDAGDRVYERAIYCRPGGRG